MPGTVDLASHPQADPGGGWADHNAHLHALHHAAHQLAATHRHPAAARLRQHLASALLCWQLGHRPHDNTSHPTHRAPPGGETAQSADPTGIRDACSRLAAALTTHHLTDSRRTADPTQVWAGETVGHLLRAAYHAQHLTRLP